MRTAERILITRMKFIGDVVLTTPVIRSVRNAYPHARIAYMGEKQAVSLLEGHPCLDEILPYDYARPALLEQARMAMLLRSRSFDLAIDLFGNPRSALLTRLSGAKVRVGPDRAGRGRLYTIRVHDDGLPKSAIAFHNQSLAAAGIPVTASNTELFPGEGERREAAARVDTVTSGTGPIVAIHPGATWPAKQWAAERFGMLAGRLAGEGMRVIVLAGPNDGERLSLVCRHAGIGPGVLTGLTLREMAAVLSVCSAFVGNDAGPMHIAAAVGTPTIGVFGPGEENIWFPYRREEGHTALRKDVPCHPCHLDVCTRGGDGYMECMKLLQVDEVAAAVRSGLSAAR
jgi:heptosyltransferase III